MLGVSMLAVGPRGMSLLSRRACQQACCDPNCQAPQPLGSCAPCVPVKKSVPTLQNLALRALMGNEIVKNVVEEEQRRAPGDLTLKKLNDALKTFNSEPSEIQERPSTSRGLNNEGVDFSGRCFLCEESDSD